MTVQCPRCRITWRGKPGLHGGRSRVVETRIVAARTRLLRHDGDRRTTRTVQRIRECLTCRYRWRTREVAVPIRKRQ